jgi:hypothetical protein
MTPQASVKVKLDPRQAFIQGIALVLPDPDATKDDSLVLECFFPNPKQQANQDCD